MAMSSLTKRLTQTMPGKLTPRLPGDPSPFATMPGKLGQPQAGPAVVPVSHVGNGVGYMNEVAAANRPTMSQFSQRLNQASGAPVGHPLYGKSPTEMRQAVASLQQRLANPNSYNAATYVSPEGKKYDATPTLTVAQMPATPIGTRKVGGMEFSGTNRPGMATLADRRLPQAQTRESLLSRLNGGLGGTQTFEQAVNDRANFNKGGHQFGGAKLALQNGRAQFVSDDRPPALAGGAANQAEALANRTRGYKALEGQNIGYLTQFPGGQQAFVGRDAMPFKGETGLAGRLAAGGVSPSTLTADQLAANKKSMTERLNAGRAERMQLVQEKAQSPMQRFRSQVREQMALAKAAADQKNNLAQQGMDFQNRQLMVQGLVGLAGNENIPAENIPAILQGMAGMGAQPAVPGAPAVPGQPGDPGRLAELLKPKNAAMYFGKLDQPSMDKAKEIAASGTDRRELVAFLQSKGLEGDQLDQALNTILGTRFRSGKNPNLFGGMENWFNWARQGQGDGSAPGPIVPGS